VLIVDCRQSLLACLEQRAPAEPKKRRRRLWAQRQGQISAAGCEDAAPAAAALCAHDHAVLVCVVPPAVYHLHADGWRELWLERLEDGIREQVR
jgi:hypothetical protein